MDLSDLISNNLVYTESSSIWVLFFTGLVIATLSYFCLNIDTFFSSKKTRKTIKKNGHLWSESNPTNPKACHECHKLLIPGQDDICECDYCGSFIHEKCIHKSKFHCKQLTSTKPQIKHLWLDGNIDIGTTCCICHEEITSFVNLSGKRCVWCQRVVHDECLHLLDEYCDFGLHAPYIISPSYVQSAYSIEEKEEEGINADTLTTTQHIPLLRSESSRSTSSVSSSTSETFSPPLLERNKSDQYWLSSSQLNSCTPLDPIFDTNEDELRYRRGSDDDDDMSIGNSPPPNLTEYKVRSNSANEPEEQGKRSRKFSFHNLMNDINPELQRYLERKKTPDHRSWKLSIPQNKTPILIFINSRSGGLYGNQLLPRFRRILHPIQVVDLQEKNPQEVLKNYACVDNLRILVCGGWVLNMIEKQQWKRVPPVAILPLGTGNDLSRSLNWGSGFVDDISVNMILQQVLTAHLTLLDRWNLQISSNKHKLLSERLFNCYFSVGADASIALRFHTMRERNPSLFNSQIINKLCYAFVGSGETLKANFPVLKNNILLKIDDVEYDVSDAANITCLNIPYYSGGGLPLGTRKDYFSSSDGLIEVIGFKNILHYATTRAGLSKAYIIGRGKHIHMELKSQLPIQVDGEPWSQKPCNLDIYFHSQAPMLIHPVSEVQEAMGIMTDSLEWAKTNDIINEKQYHVLLTQFQTRMKAMIKSRSSRSDSF